MKSLSELTKGKDPKLYIDRRKDQERRDLVSEFTKRLNLERLRENEEKISKYMWTKHVSRPEAVKALKKASKEEKIWPPHTERAIHFKTMHLNEAELRDFLDMCNTAEKDKRSFGKVFFGKLRIKK